MKCPNCGLINPETAERCDCGYDFLTGIMKESYLSEGSEISGQQYKYTSIRRKTGKRNMLFGAFCCIGGILVTSISYNAAASDSSDGHYIIPWGAIAFGAILFFKGVYQYLDKREIQPSRKK